MSFSPEFHERFKKLEQRILATEGTDFSREEYRSWIKDNEGGFHQLPKDLLNNEEFMTETAAANPNSAYRYAGGSKKRY